jgi:uncharacterized protein YyaL (SSP411 family)
LSAWHAEHAQVVIVGRPADPQTLTLRAELAQHYRPFAIVIPVAPGGTQAALAERLPFVGAMTMRAERPTAYVCRNFSCREPVTAPEALAAQM